MAEIKTSLPSKVRHFGLNSSHLTTMDFLKTQPVYYRRLVPGQKISVDVNSFARLADMPVPTFGEANLRVLGFFIPYRTVWQNFNSFIASTMPDGFVSGNVQQTVPYITNIKLCNEIFQTDYSGVFFDVVNNDDVADFYVAAPTSEPNDRVVGWVRMRDTGKFIVKVLHGLGYIIDPRVTTEDNDVKFNVLDLLCYIRAHFDWLYSKHLVNDVYYRQISVFFSNTAVHGLLSNDFISQIVSWLDFLSYMPYASNRFTDAFDNPVGPNGSSSINASFVLPDESQGSRSGGNASYNTASQFVSVNSSVSTTSLGVNNTTPSINTQSLPTSTSNAQALLTNITTSQLQTLQALTAYIRRNQIAGSRAFERLYAMFGIKPDADVFDRSYYLGDYKVPLEVSDVMSTSDTQGAVLGSYAGKGYMIDTSSKNGHFEFNNDSTDFGLFLLVGYIDPRVTYPYGLDAMQTQLTRLQFFTGDFDGIGTEAISSSEVSIGLEYNDLGTTSSPYSKIFGFTPRYSIYKTPRDLMSGDFRLHSRNNAGITSRSWHFARQFGALNTSFTPPTVNQSFVVSYDGDQYDRIFYNTDSNYDHFITNFLFKVDTWFAAKPLYAFDDFEHETEHKDVDVNPGGIQKV